MRTIIDTVAVCETAKAFSIQMPSKYKSLSVEWDCNTPKPISCSDLYCHLTKLELDDKDLFECGLIPAVLKHIPTLSHLSISTNIPERMEIFDDDITNAFISPHQWESKAMEILNECQSSFYHP
eukprot:814554_1